MSDHHIPAAEAYVVKQGGLIYVRFSKEDEVQQGQETEP